MTQPPPQLPRHLPSPPVQSPALPIVHHPGLAKNSWEWRKKMARGGREGENKRLIDRDTMTAGGYAGGNSRGKRESSAPVIVGGH